MQTTIHEIADGIHRLSTNIPDAAPGGFTFNQYLIDAEEPLLFHTGPRGLFPLVSAAAAQVLDLDRLRWISFGHVESDECGAMNDWLATCPHAEVLFNPLGCDVSLNDLADRPPVVLADDETRDLGGRRIRLLATPHVPHNWEAQVLFEETTRTLFCGDLFAQLGDGPAIVHGDIVDAALVADDLFGASSLTPSTAPTLRRLAALEPRTLAVMHGSVFVGDAAGALRRLADAYGERLGSAMGQAAA